MESTTLTPDALARDEWLKEKARAICAAWKAEEAGERMARIAPRDRAVALNRLFRQRLRARRLART